MVVIDSGEGDSGGWCDLDKGAVVARSVVMVMVATRLRVVVVVTVASELEMVVVVHMGATGGAMLLTGCLHDYALHIIEEQVVCDRPYHGPFALGPFEDHHLCMCVMCVCVMCVCVLCVCVFVCVRPRMCVFGGGSP